MWGEYPDLACWRISSIAAAFASFSSERPIRADQLAHTVAEPHRSSYPDAAVFRASALPDQIVVPQALAVGRSEHGIDPPALFGVATIIAPSGLAEYWSRCFSLTQ